MLRISAVLPLVLVSALPASGATIGELARTKVPALWEAVVTELQAVREDALPHETKDLRKQIGKLRDHIDLFAPVYGEREGKDLWKKLRKDLDVGYETAGAFKDLFDRQGLAEGFPPEEIEYPKSELKKKRAAFLEWREEFLKPQALRTRSAYLEEPLSDRFFERESKDLSRFFWGASETKAQVRLDAYANFARLSADLLTLAIGDLEHLLETDLDLSEVKDQEEFHDFRKRLRSVLKLLDYFPEVLRERSDELRAELLGIVSAYGAINDLIVARAAALEQDQEKKAKKLKKKIREEWESLRERQREERVRERILELRDRLI